MTDGTPARLAMLTSMKPAIVGTGEVEGAPVEILLFTGPTEPVAYVVSTADCSLVRKQTLG